MTMGKKLPVKQFEISTRREIAFPKPRYEEFLLPLKNKRDSCWKSNMFATEKKKNPQNKFALNIILVRKKKPYGRRSCPYGAGREPLVWIISSRLTMPRN